MLVLDHEGYELDAPGQSLRLFVRPVRSREGLKHIGDRNNLSRYRDDPTHHAL